MNTKAVRYDFNVALQSLIAYFNTCCENCYKYKGHRYGALRTDEPPEVRRTVSPYAETGGTITWNID